ncbi:DUF3010 family protein [Poseidonibacter lekithochrous]|uniref:DUF3010 family protein n=1 Tax=Poseidonibacter TaxID=2321187 RepID=UPI001C08A56E|nr:MULTISPECIES: DUF3010 family protein [Poseidonibacter]MBU3013143.1 DUF3010 family protein [Poseidonibacter lekithochrous]MDO6826439.1 DUF3010 family protein [Poseidonibacter sp. 1_MG-2023]
MKVCGIELKSNYTVLTLVDYSSDDIIDYIDLKIKKITLEDDEDKNSVLKYLEEINTFFNNNKVEKILIKKRSKKGAFSGGAVSFKMEGLIQLYSNAEVKLIPSQSISSYEKKNTILFPFELKKYQEQAYLTIVSYLTR